MRLSHFALATSLAIALPVCAATAATETVLARFTGGGGFAFGTSAARPLSDVIQDANGVLYGTTNFGGNGCGSNGVGCGTVFQLTQKSPGSAVWKLKILTSFSDGSDGGYPSAGVTAGSNGILYGTTSGGGNGVASSGAGLVFQLTPPAPGKKNWKRTTLFTFAGGTDGSAPQGKLLLDASGALYGTTQGGGTSNNGTVFKLTPPAPGGKHWTETVLYRFLGGTDGSQPLCNLYMDANGALYGTTSLGGNDNNEGTVFKLDPPPVGSTTWTEEVLFRFPGGSNGAFPAFSGLVADANGVLYGTTFAGGGAHNAGVVFALAPGKTWKESVLYRFQGTSDGKNPNDGVMLDTSGNLYGTALNGTPSGFGDVFKLAPPAAGMTAWTFTNLHTFAGTTDGSSPWSTLLVKTDGSLLGTTSQGGNGCPNITANGCGTVFQIVQ